MGFIKGGVVTIYSSRDARYIGHRIGIGHIGIIFSVIGISLIRKFGRYL